MFERLWGSTGDVVEPPATKAEEGFNTTEYPRHDQTNWFLNLASRGLQQLERTGVFDWDSSTPYQAGVTRRYSGAYYYSLTATTGDQPNSSPTQWKPIPSQNYIHAISQVNGLQAALNAKSDDDHTHAGVYSPVSHNHAGTYAPVSHTHSAGQVTGLGSGATATVGIGSSAQVPNRGQADTRYVRFADATYTTPVITVSASDPPAAGQKGRIWMKT